MSEERERELYNHLQGLSKDEIIGITIREFNENRYFREVKIGEYLKENQQLKDELKLVESLASFNMPNNTPMVCMFKADYERNKYEYETIDKYKSVLDEIREYIIKRTKTIDINGIEKQLDEFDILASPKTILQILDKVKENERGTTESNKS